MCGRYTLTFEEVKEIEDFLNAWDSGILPPEQSEISYGNYNVAPTHNMPVSYVTAEGKRIIELMSWGFMGWKPKPGQRVFSPINTRDDSIAKKPMWSRAFQAKRCIVPISGFYEWKGPKGSKTPYYIYPKKEEFLGVAGIYSNLSPDDGRKSFSIITTSPNKVMEGIHDRMPAFLHPSEFDTWLNPEQPEDLLLDMLHPYPDDAIQAHIVSKAVGNVRNNMPELINPSTLL